MGISQFYETPIAHKITGLQFDFFKPHNLPLPMEYHYLFYGVIWK